MRVKKWMLWSFDDCGSSRDADSTVLLRKSTIINRQSSIHYGALGCVIRGDRSARGQECMTERLMTER